MALVSLVYLQAIALPCIAALIVYRVYWGATTGAARHALATQHGCLPAKQYTSKYTIFGIDHFLSNMKAYREHKLLESWTRILTSNNAHTMTVKMVGQTIYWTDDPDNVKAMLAVNFDQWSLGQERIQQMSAYLGHGIFTSEGAAWKRSRDMLRPCFERSQVADVSIMEKHTGRLLQIVPRDGTTVDLQPLLHELTLDVATEFLFGRSTDALDYSREDTACKEFIEAFEYCQNPMGERNEKYGILGMFLPDRKFKKCAKAIRDFTDKIIDKEIASQSPAEKDAGNQRYVFLDELSSATQNRTVIRSELLNILLAGRDTTASLLSNLIWELSRQPEMLTRLRQEIEDSVGNDIPTYQQLKDMKYLKALINESQRMYPIVPSNSRQALHDTILPRGGGPDGQSPTLVPKGAYVVYLPWSMHRRPDVFGEDAHKFDPTRWLDEGHDSSPLRPGWAYLPFSGGPRICIGQNFALTECMFVVVRLLQTFHVEGRDDEPWREKLGITCVGLGGCKVGLRPRS
ncbi:uncharacterized protein N0V89_007369 [Didymosphaeria variabile]|uniref:P450 monooxygenase n=1 Tax=Didymosphaeria variabile TaxID=1932322 RepID=A0A9W8XKY8_9PLEO|nr:uncharacterized protein N0V89_007369 [Didymosphaeria variabile]KAJ4352023.1 hypothetical protein N0V89_007369 [Didymosphaeria variabile]